MTSVANDPSTTFAVRCDNGFGTSKTLTLAANMASPEFGG